MNFSRFFIDRPIFAIVISVFITLIGAFSYPLLPLSQYPEIAPPTIAIQAAYPGASAETLAETVAAPIEQEVNGVENMLYMSSSSTSDGVVAVTVTFQPGTDLDAAQVLVQNRVALAEPRLPEQVRQIGVTVNKQATDFLLLVALTSPDESLDVDYMGNYANSTLRDRMLRIEGVGQVQVFGGGNYSMRIWIDPAKAAARNLTAPEIINALRGQNTQAAAGAIGQPPYTDNASAFQLPVQVESRLSDPEQFANVVIKSDAEGRVTRVRDVARVELGSQDYGIRGYFSGERGVAMAIVQQPGANALNTAHAVLTEIEALAGDFPPGMAYLHSLQPDRIRGALGRGGSAHPDRGHLPGHDRGAGVPADLARGDHPDHRHSRGPGRHLRHPAGAGLFDQLPVPVRPGAGGGHRGRRRHHRGRERGALHPRGPDPAEAAYKSMREVSGALIAISLVLVAVFVPTAFVLGHSGHLLSPVRRHHRRAPP